MVSCSSNDESGNDISYTSEEIVQILTGKWEIHGHVTVSDGTNIKVDNDYTGTIEFKADQSYNAKSSVINTVPGVSVAGSNKVYYDDLDIQNYLSGTPYRYTILRKNSNYYLAFGSSNHPGSTFQIVSLTKKSFKLVEEDKVFEWGAETQYRHYYVTIISNWVLRKVTNSFVRWHNKVINAVSARHPGEH